MKKKKAQTVRSSHPEEIKEILAPDMGSVQKWGLPLMFVILAAVLGMMCLMKFPQTVTYAYRVSEISADSALLFSSDAVADDLSSSVASEVSLCDFPVAQYGKTNGRRLVVRPKGSRKGVPAMIIALRTDRDLRLPLRKGMAYKVTIREEDEPLLNLIFSSLTH